MTRIWRAGGESNYMVEYGRRIPTGDDIVELNFDSVTLGGLPV